MEQELSSIARSGKTPRLLLHSCCGPCSTSVIERLADFFEISVFYYNPNIYPEAEYEKRKSEQIRLLSDPSYPHRVSIVDAEYNPDAFDAAVRGLENEPEGGRRCERCFLLRLEETARKAQAGGFDYFTTTLTVSPHKDAGQISVIGATLADRYGVSYLFSDFKKWRVKRSSRCPWRYVSTGRITAAAYSPCLPVFQMTGFRNLFPGMRKSS